MRRSKFYRSSEGKVFKKKIVLHSPWCICVWSLIIKAFSVVQSEMCKMGQTATRRQTWHYMPKPITWLGIKRIVELILSKHIFILYLLPITFYTSVCTSTGSKIMLVLYLILTFSKINRQSQTKEYRNQTQKLLLYNACECWLLLHKILVRYHYEDQNWISSDWCI